jgi:deoxyadenosine/deoxycytidine kinase
MESTVKAPDLLIYLRSSIPNLVDKFTVASMNPISIDYLSRLNERYEAWVDTYDRVKLIIDMTTSTC